VFAAKQTAFDSRLVVFAAKHAPRHSRLVTFVARLVQFLPGGINRKARQFVTAFWRNPLRDGHLVPNALHTKINGVVAAPSIIV
jgi:hypothetical protein